MKQNIIYFDHSVTTPVDPRVLEAMMPYWVQDLGHPPSMYHVGHPAQVALRQARETVAAILNCQPGEIIFTSGGTESNNLALRGVAQAMKRQGKGNHLIVTQTEHYPVLNTAQALLEDGFEVTFLPVDSYGRVTEETVLEALRTDTILVSVNYANSEVGTINPIGEIGLALRERGVFFHTDAVQAPGLLCVDVSELNVDLLSISGHKFYGPKGIGALYIRAGVPLRPQITGGGQEAARRAGVEPLPLIVGLAEALKLAEADRETTVRHLIPLRDFLMRRLLLMLSGAQLIGHPIKRLPGHTSFILDSVNCEAVLLELANAGVITSPNQTYWKEQPEPSHVLKAMKFDENLIRGQMRFVLGKKTTWEDLDQLLQQLATAIMNHVAEEV